MHKTLAAVLSVALVAGVLSAEDTSAPAASKSSDRLDITTRSGVTYERCKVTRVEPDGISVFHSKGIAKIAFPDLPAEYQEKYGFDPERATLYSSKMAATRQKAAAASREREAKLRAEQDRMTEIEAKKQNARRIRGHVIQATSSGLLVKAAGPSLVVASSSAAIGGGGAVYSPPDPKGKGRPRSAYGRFWLVDHPKSKTTVDGDYIDVDAYEDGTHSYTTVLRSSSRVKRYVVIKAY